MPMESEVDSVRHFTFTKLRNLRRKINKRLALSGALSKTYFFFECLFVHKSAHQIRSLLAEQVVSGMQLLQNSENILYCMKCSGLLENSRKC